MCVCIYIYIFIYIFLFHCACNDTDVKFLMLHFTCELKFTKCEHVFNITSILHENTLYIKINILDI